MVTGNKKKITIPQTLRQKVWNYMRRNRNFVIGDIMAITGIGYPNLRDMLKNYELAGYVKPISKEKPLTSNRYKLIKNSGVRVPMYDKRKGILYDPNLDLKIEVKRKPSLIKILEAITKTPITKEEINKITMLSHATNVKCYAKLKQFKIMTRPSPLQKNNEGYILFNIDFDEIESFKNKVERGEIDVKRVASKSL